MEAEYNGNYEGHKNQSVTGGDSPGIKARLCNNSESVRTPEKLRRDATPIKSAKRLQALYGAEGKSMEAFLKAGANSSVNSADNSGNDSEDTEVSLKKSVKDVITAVQTNPDKQSEADMSAGVNAVNDATSKDIQVLKVQHL